MQLKRVFGGRASVEERTQLDQSRDVERFDEEQLREEGEEEALVSGERENSRRWREAPRISVDGPPPPSDVQ